MSVARYTALALLVLILTGGSSLPSGSNLANSHSSVLNSNGTLARFKSGASADTFCLYGGPGSLHGKFQHADLSPVTLAELASEPTSVPGEPDGWSFIDPSDQPVYWQNSTFNMENLNSNGPGNQGMWAGRNASQVGWANAPGYGNGWNAQLEWRTNDVDPANSQSISLDFFYNLDSEMGFDFFEVEYDSAGSTVVALSVSGSTAGGGGTFAAPGTIASLSLPYESNAYPGGEIVIRLAARSDGGYSDEDGIIDTDGFVQVDDITVGWTDAGGSPASDTDSFEGLTSGPDWVALQNPFAGYFGQVFAVIEDNDPCRENATPMFAFIDDGTPPSNPAYTGTGTGGTTSLNWSYGIPGGFVVNYNGGLTNNLINLENHISTPAIAWDLPGTADDAANIQGARMRFTVWRHLPLLNGMFYTWNVRARDSVTQQWVGWVSRSFVYYGGGASGDWLNTDLDVSDLVLSPNGRDAVQVTFIALDAANVFSFPGTDATISPAFDNIAFRKYAIGGPSIVARTIDIFNDAFPSSGLTAHGTEAERDQLDIRLDMARNVDPGSTSIDPGDSIVVDVTNVVPGNSVAVGDIKLHWALHTNPYFEDSIRGNLTTGSGPGGAWSESLGTGYNGWDVWTGDQAVVGGASVASDRYAFDLPDADFFYPGDILEWYVQATDDGAATGGPQTSTLPNDLSGFNGGAKDSYNHVFTVQGLPTMTSGGQPEILLINNFGHRGGINDYQSAFGQIGMERGAKESNGFAAAEYDMFTVNGPSSFVDNSIGTPGGHGATAPQLQDYSCIMWVWGNLKPTVISQQVTPADDEGVLTDWHNQAANRSLFFFADNHNGSAPYQSTIQGLSVVGDNVSPEIGGAVAPTVRPTVAGVGAGFLADWVAFGGCLGINDFDQIVPVAPGPDNYAAHEFVGHQGQVASSAGSVVFDRMDGGFRKLNVSFPFGMVYVYNGGITGAGGGFSDRAVLLQELFDLAAHPRGPVVTDSADLPPEALFGVAAAPNPFNPRTELSFHLGSRQPVTINVYNLAGRRVRVLLNQEILSAGPQQVIWDGRDSSGRSVSSGVYVARISTPLARQQIKIALVK